jgi:hypothetical protein
MRQRTWLTLVAAAVIAVALGSPTALAQRGEGGRGGDDNQGRGGRGDGDNNGRGGRGDGDNGGRGGNDDRVTICHRPPGNPSNTQTIVVNQSAVAGHLRHGDTLGPCPVSPSR